MQLNTSGRYSLTLEKNILFIEASGPFNDILVADFLKDMNKLTRGIEKDLWGGLVTYIGNGIFTPEAEQAVINLTKQKMKNNLIAVAAVIKNSHQAELQHMQLSRIYQNCNMVFNVFSESKSAQQWLNGYLSQQKNIAS